MPDAATRGALLSVRDLHSWYGESHILQGAAFDVAAGEVVTLLGRNGAGKTTTLKSIMGIVGQRKGSVLFDGAETIRLPSNRIARILRTGARLLMLDEPTEGLAPVIVQQIGRTIGELKRAGFTILLVEQNFRFAATVADRHYVMERGRIIDMIPNIEIDAKMGKLHEYLGV